MYLLVCVCHSLSPPLVSPHHAPRERLQELRGQLTSPLVGMQAANFLPVVCDVTKEAEVRNLPQIITKHWPDTGIDVLVNNAGEGGTGPADAAGVCVLLRGFVGWWW